MSMKIDTGIAASIRASRKRIATVSLKELFVLFHAPIVEWVKRIMSCIINVKSSGSEAKLHLLTVRQRFKGEYNKNNHSPKKPKDREQSESHIPPANEEDGIPISTSGLLQVVERRQPLSSVSSLEVHFDLMDLTELTDMSDQELAEVFADSDDESQPHDSPAELNQLYPIISHGTHLKSPSWTRAKSEQTHDRKHPNDPDASLKMSDHFQTVEAHKKP